MHTIYVQMHRTVLLLLFEIKVQIAEMEGTYSKLVQLFYVDLNKNFNYPFLRYRESTEDTTLLDLQAHHTYLTNKNFMYGVSGIETINLVVSSFN